MKKSQFDKLIREEIKKYLKEDHITEGRGLTAFVLSVGIINILTGKTGHGWSIYDRPGALYVYLTKQKSLLLAVKGTFKKGDSIQMRDNDSQRKLKWGEVDIIDLAPAKKDAVLKMLLKNKFDYYPTKPFRKKRFPYKLKTSFSVKGVTDGKL